MRTEEEIKITAQDVADGFETILKIDQDIIPSCDKEVTKNGRNTLIAVALYGQYSPEAKDAKTHLEAEIPLKNLYAINAVLDKVLDNLDAFYALGGIVNCIKNSKLDALADLCFNGKEI